MTATGKMPRMLTRAGRRLLLPALTCLLLLLAGCDVLPPSRPVPAEQQSAPFKAPTLSAVSAASAADNAPGDQAPGEPTQVPNCTNDLDFIEDLSIPDGTQLAPAKTIVKEWKVRNSGSCNWNADYSVRLISGDALGVEPVLALVPARNGTEAVISIEFTTPADPGRYSATWRAHGPAGEPFGEWFTIEIAVTTP